MAPSLARLLSLPSPPLLPPACMPTAGLAPLRTATCRALAATLGTREAALCCSRLASPRWPSGLRPGPAVTRPATFSTSVRRLTQQPGSSLPDEEGDEPDRLFAREFKVEDVPVDRMTFLFSKGSKDAGETVNDAATKVEMRFKVGEADWLPKWVRRRLKQEVPKRINTHGELILTSEKTSKRYENIRDCVEQLHNIIQRISYIPPEPPEEDLEWQKETVKRSKEVLRHDKEQQQKRSSVKRVMRNDY